uniref:Trafficking protein particle complex subunit 6B n=1 Tax=Strigamia maritima TaxID=126957 RepID=T1J5T8_STRMM
MADDVLLDFFHMEIVAYSIQSTRKEERVDYGISKLEYIGFTTGFRFVERLTRDLPRFKEELDIVKFICKDYWMAICKKQIDSLLTNYEGMYVLQDNNFRFLSQLSSGRQYLELAPKFVAFMCGMIRGALTNLGIMAVVTAETSSLPACK